MGVPKFYRWISERYPCLSEVVKEFQLPEFDNLYLDMNGIIHVCSHPDDENPHFRMTEEQMFKDICHYIDFLFRMIKPRKVFYMAVDGVAPRAKMNQQRGRRFRSAREAETLIEQAKAKGEVLPTEKRFDSNCITPGTPFMVRLQEHLKYFVVDKVSNDPLWQGPSIYLSGHETPGEGEHKVMDFIRYSKSQPGYDPDTRHCLYGLDADLIMLGLTSHEPHFSLLREEVRFGGRKDKNKRPPTPEETTFHLLHLSLLRDYLAYEFHSLKGKLSFEWNIEKIIDDWILMGFLVGNDFIPHLPHLHIKNDALPLLWETYIKVLPQLDGYINEDGHLNLPRFEKYLEELSEFDRETFESGFSDFKALEEKIGGKTINESIGSRSKAKKLKPFKMKTKGVKLESLESCGGSLEKDNQFTVLSNSDDDSESDEDSGAESTDSLDDFLEDDEYRQVDGGDMRSIEFRIHKRDYYMTKMEFKAVTPEVLRDQACGYVKAIQWILLYYFEGCPSWSWFYQHHYAPYVSDVKNFSNMKMEFDLATPFLPFQQLMAVLPAASIDLIPPALQPLMIEESSPVKDFYPVNFDQDLNGKQQDWEAVVLIPFIEEERLLTAMASKEHLLTKDEAARNCHGPHFVYSYTPDNNGFYPSPTPAVFPDINISRARIEEVHKDLFRITPDQLVKGLLKGVRPEVYFPGFPTLKFLPHTHELKKAGVKVFQQSSRSENMLLQVKATPGQKLETIADDILGKSIYVGWPHIHEAKVIGVANESFRLELVEEVSKAKGADKNTVVQSFNRRKLTDEEANIVYRESSSLRERQLDRFGICVGNTEVLVYACQVTGRNFTYGSTGLITMEKQYAQKPTAFAHQMTIKDLQVEESAHSNFKTLEEVFPEGSTIFMLGLPHYGAQGIVRETLPSQGRVRISLSVTEEPDFQRIAQGGSSNNYMPPGPAAQRVGINNHLLSRITGSVFVNKSGDKGGRVNVGLNLKFTKRREEVPGYTCYQQNYGWAYSPKCVEVVKSYLAKYSQMWTKIEQNTKQTDVYSEDEIVGEDCAFTLTDVEKFLADLPSTKAPKMKFGSKVLSDEEVALIEQTTEALIKKADIVKIKVKPRLLFRSQPGQGSLVPDPEADFLLYDRVVVVKSGYSVPYGKRGTVIGLPSPEEEAHHAHTLYDVVFDEAFSGGIKLRCSNNKGYRVPGSAMLNITFGEFRKKTESTEKPDFWARQNSGIQPNGSNAGPSSRQNFNTNNSFRPNDRSGPYKSRASTGQPPQPRGQTMWDSRRQPVFGQVFSSRAGLNQYDNQPRYVTPKMQDSKVNNVSNIFYPDFKSKESPKTSSDNCGFENMWKELQRHQQGKSESPSSTPRSQGPERMEACHQTSAAKPALLATPSGPAVSSSIKPANCHNNTKPTEAAPSANSDQFPNSDQFLNLFNSLKMAGSQSKTSTPQTEASPAEQPAQSKADEQLKQLLKIGDSVPVSVSQSLSPSTVNSAATSLESKPKSPVNRVTNHNSKPLSETSNYGRQVSLQELFEEADRQQKAQNKPGQQTSANIHNQSDSRSRTDKSPSELSAIHRDPQVDLANYCRMAFNGATPGYDYKHQPHQLTYIANVILPNSRRFEGSQCKSKEEAAKSAAGMAMLCLNTKQNMGPPIMMQNLGSGPPPGHMNRFYSSNSAFSPIGMPGMGGMMARGPSNLLLTPQHFLNQPPPTVPLHQMYQQQHMPQQSRHPGYSKEWQRFQNPADTRTAAEPASGHPDASPSKPASGQPDASPSKPQSGAQMFIPMQVSRNQKTPVKKRESQERTISKPTFQTPEKQEITTEGSSPHLKAKEDKNVAVYTPTSLAEQRVPSQISTQENPKIVPSTGSEIIDNTTVSAASSKDHGNGVPLEKSSTSQPAAPSLKTTKKKKSRIAANFSKPINK